jgi:hypothetical protein
MPLTHTAAPAAAVAAASDFVGAQLCLRLVKLIGLLTEVQ